MNNRQGSEWFFVIRHKIKVNDSINHSKPRRNHSFYEYFAPVIITGGLIIKIMHNILFLIRSVYSVRCCQTYCVTEFNLVVMQRSRA